jgi:hypothetical protein
MEEQQEGMALGMKQVDTGGQVVARACAPPLEGAGPADARVKGTRLGDPAHPWWLAGAVPQEGEGRP